MLLTLLLLVCSSLYCLATPSPGCGSPLPATPHPGRHHKFPITVEDPLQGPVSREYNIHIPAHYNTSNNVAVPLVLDYHGWGGTTHYQMVLMPWRDVADMDHTGFVQGGIKYFTSWEPILSAKNFARNSGSQTRQKTSKIAVIWVFLPVTRNFFL